MQRCRRPVTAAPGSGLGRAQGCDDLLFEQALNRDPSRKRLQHVVFALRNDGRWSPDRRRSGLHLYGIFLSAVNAVDPFSAWSRFGSCTQSWLPHEMATSPSHR